MSGHPAILILNGVAYALLDGTLMAAAVPIDGPVPPLLAGTDGLAEYTLNDEWCEVDFYRIDDCLKKQCCQAHQILQGVKAFQSE